MAAILRESRLGLKILKVVGLGVFLLAVSVIAPQFPYIALRAALKKKFGRDYRRSKLINAVSYLKRKKFIAYANGKYSITPIGRERLAEAEITELRIEKQKWDGKWRFVSFDVPEPQRPARLAFGRKLKQVGFYNFQRSLFVIPYPCEKEVQALSRLLKIEPHVHIFRAERFSNDRKLRKIFSL